MSGDAAIESWLASMSESELIDQCFFWHDMALEHGRMYNAIKDENAKLRELCKRVLKNCYDAYEQVWGWDDDWVILCDEARELGVEME